MENSLEANFPSISTVYEQIESKQHFFPKTLTDLRQNDIFYDLNLFVRIT